MKRRKQLLAATLAFLLCFNVGVNVNAQTDVTPTTVAEETLADEGTVENETVEEEPVEEAVEEETVVDDEVVTEETPVVDDEVVTEETPVVEDEVVTEETPVVEDEVVTEETPVVDDEVVTEETSVVEDTPSVMSLSEEGIAVIEEDALDAEVVKTKLAAPTELGWGDNLSIKINAVPECHGHYAIILFKDGVQMENEHTINFGTQEGVIEYSFSPDTFEESGNYTFKIKAINKYDPDTLEDSEWVESPVYSYVKPVEVLGTTNVFWDTEQPGVIHFYGVDNAASYRIRLYTEQEVTGEWTERSSSWSSGFANNDVSSNLHTRDISDMITRIGGGQVRVTVQALSCDIDVLVHGAESALSEIYDAGITVSSVGTKLDEILAANNPMAGRDALKDMGISSIRMAMQTDAATRNKVKQLEEQYMQAQGISAKAPEVSSEASAYVDSSRISMVGAGLNVTSGSVNLAVSVPTTLAQVPSNNYKNSVQLDIKLMNDNASKSELDVPITITMPLPTGVSSERLTILHYHADGSREIINPMNNGDGTITFTVTKFSTFVFANEGTGEQGGNQENGGSQENNDDNWSPEYYEQLKDDMAAREAAAVESEQSANQNGATQLISPQTADSVMPIVAVVVAMLAMGGCMIMLKRRVRI